MFSQTPYEHINHTALLISFLKEVSVTLKLMKSAFFRKRINCLGPVACPGRLDVVNQKTTTIGDLKIPSTQNEFRLFIGFCIVCRRFVPNFAYLTSPFEARPSWHKQKTFLNWTEKGWLLSGLYSRSLSLHTYWPYQGRMQGTPSTRTHVIANDGVWYYESYTTTLTQRLNIDQRS